jgi:hypothetical protein
MIPIVRDPETGRIWANGNLAFDPETETWAWSEGSLARAWKRLRLAFSRKMR